MISKQRHRETGAGRVASKPRRPRSTSGGEGADHEDLGVREVDQAQHAVDQGVAERDEGVDRALVEARDGQLRETPDQIIEVQQGSRAPA